MKDIEIAINCGYHIDDNGNILDKDGNQVKTSIKSGLYKMFCFTYLKKKYRIYASRLQSYKKFGEKSFNENVAYVNGNSLDCSYDNIILRSIQTKNRNSRESKTCSRCNKEFPMESFLFKNKSTGLRISECPECNKKLKRECYHRHFEKNKTKINIRNKEFREIRNEFLRQKKYTGCVICQEKDIGCLDFHHLGDKKYNISSIFTNLSIKEIEEEIQKCIILCANCHRKLHYYNLTIDELKEKHIKK